MKNNKSSGAGLILLIIAAAFLFGGGGAALLKSVLAIAAMGLVGVIALVVLLIVLATKDNGKKGQSGSQNQNINKSAAQSGARFDPYTGQPINQGVQTGNRTEQMAAQTAARRQEMAADSRLTPEDAETLKQGRQKLMFLRHEVVKIHNPEIRGQANEICGVMDKILQTLRTQHADEIKDVRQFFNYYLPTLQEILSKYARIEASGVQADAMADKVSTYLKQIKQAMDKQYENLFEDDKLDLSVEMEAMTLACKRDGLLEDENASKVSTEGEQGITLTL